MEITYENLLSGLYIAVAIMVLIVLYHVLFIVVDVRKIVRRAANMTEEIQTVIMKPVSIADKAMDWVVGFLEGQKEHHAKKHHDHHKHS
jgi:hypothetical protein